MQRLPQRWSSAKLRHPFAPPPPRISQSRRRQRVGLREVSWGDSSATPAVPRGYDVGGGAAVSVPLRAPTASRSSRHRAPHLYCAVSGFAATDGQFFCPLAHGRTARGGGGGESVGWSDGQTDRQTDRRTYRRTDRQSSGNPYRAATREVRRRSRNRR